MATWDDQQYASELPTTPTPEVKFEASPAESFLSIPGELYPSLFDAVTPMSTTMDPSESVMTPDSSAGDDTTANPSTPDPDSTPAATPAADGEKKPAKKRKSWGQVLPEPKTNLPPR